MVHERAERWTGLRTPRGDVLRDEDQDGDDQGINTHDYFGEYHGHTIPHLTAVLHEIRRGSQEADGERSIVFLVGDSTLDNKYWLPGMATASAINGFERVLRPAVMQRDVAYWVNRELIDRGLGARAACLNCAVEESTLDERSGAALLPQDRFVQQHLGADDVLVISVGGNDIALRPSLATSLSVVALMASPRWLLESGYAPGMWHIMCLFRERTRDFAKTLCANGSKPRCIVVCMLYFLDEACTPSWAATTLKALGYDKDPTKLQLLTRKMYELATRRIQIDGVEVIPLPLFEGLDGKDPADYVQRVEPSSAGGQKMARLLVDRISRVLGGARA